MKIINIAVPILDFYKKSPDLNTNSSEYKTSKITLCASIIFIFLVILFNFNSISNLWISQRELQVVGDIQILESQKITPFTIAYFFQSGCLAKQYPLYYILFTMRFCVNFPKVPCNQEILNRFNVASNPDSCMVCFSVDNLQVENNWYQAFRIFYLNKGPIPRFKFIIQHPSYNQETNQIEQSMQYQIVENVSTQFYVPVLCQVKKVIFDNSLYDWQTPQSLSYFTDCGLSYWKGVGISATGVVVNSITKTSYQRLKISVIISEIVSFGLLVSLFAVFLTSYDQMIFKIEVARENFDLNEKNYSDLDINYLQFIWLKILKIETIRNYIIQHNIYPKGTYLFFLLRKVNRILSIENIVYPLDQIEEIEKSSPSIMIEESQMNPPSNTGLIGQTTLDYLQHLNGLTTEQNKIEIFKPQFKKNQKKSIWKKYFQIFDLFSVPIQFEEEQDITTSKTSIFITIVSLAIICYLGYYSNFIQTFQPPVNEFMMVSNQAQLNINPDVFKLYLVVANSDTGKALRMNQIFLNVSLTLQEPDGTITQFPYQLDCPLLPGFIYLETNIVQFCFKPKFRFHSSFQSFNLLNLSIKQSQPRNIRYRFVVVEYYQSYQNGIPFMRWQKVQFNLPKTKDPVYTMNGTFWSNIFITRGVLKVNNLFKMEEVSEGLFVRNIFQQEEVTDNLDQPFRLDFMFKLTPEQLEMIQPTNYFFNLIINLLGISYLSLLVLIKLCSSYYNKQKSLRHMSKKLQLLQNDPTELNVLRQCLFGSEKIKPKQENNNSNNSPQESHKKIKQIEHNLLNINNILKMKSKIQSNRGNRSTFFMKSQIRTNQNIQQEHEQI